MKNLHFVLFLFIFLVSCEKEETTNSDIPEWLEPRIEELENSEHCNWYLIDRYLYKGEYYYDVVNSMINCILCEVYDSHGNLVNFDGNGQTDFLDNRKNRKTIWICPDFSTE